MRIGFIGAGKVGCSLGAYWGRTHDLVGYASKSFSSAQEAARLTGSQAFEDAGALCAASEAVFVTTPDGQIAAAWHALQDAAEEGCLRGKLVCHCSGSLPSTVLDGAKACGASAYSVHPLFAVSSKQVAAEELSRAFFTVEGDIDRIDDALALVKAAGNPVQVIDAAEKTRYHAAAALASNHVVALYRLACDELARCGFAPRDAEGALAPLFLGNAEHIAHDGTVAALTGPAERGDMDTIARHLDCLDGPTHEVYRLLNDVLLRIADEKHGRA